MGNKEKEADEEKKKKGEEGEDGKKDEPPMPPVPRKTQCLLCLTYEMGSIVIGAIDAAFTIIIVILVVILSKTLSSVNLSPAFTRTMYAFPIVALVVVFVPRILGGGLAFLKRYQLNFRRLHSIIRSVTSVIMFALSMSLLIILVLMYKGTNSLIQMTQTDMDFIKGDRMKWGIILLALILIVGTMIDLYFSLAVRTFYLTMLHYPDIITAPPPAEEKPKAPPARASKYKTPTKDQNVT